MEIVVKQLYEPAFRLWPRPPKGRGPEAPPVVLRPKVGTTVLVAHALGAGAVPADLEGAGFEVLVATDADDALARSAWTSGHCDSRRTLRK